MVLKLRAWAKSRKKMVPVLNINFEYGSVILPIETGDDDYYWWSTTEWKLEEVELMEYIGLEDIDNKEIYEDDIVTYEEGEYSFTAVVTWVGWKWVMEDINSDEVISFDDVADDKQADLKIIGNIYQSEDLLKETKYNERKNCKI